MPKAALVIMAAGLGSRYGGVKQISGVGPNGEILMEYAIHDAVQAGFDQVVFIVTRPILDGLREKFEAPLRALGVETAFAIQDTTSLPPWFEAPLERSKPYGTAHAVLCTRGLVQVPFAVINADDYYGREAFPAMYETLLGLQPGQAAMMGYQLRNTVSKYGAVTRGVCTVADGLLQSVTETYQIEIMPDGRICDNSGDQPRELDANAPVSMNFWGFRPEVFSALDDYLRRFLRQRQPGDLKSECLLPALVDERIRLGALSVRVLHTDARWFGMTYQEDRPIVQGDIARLHEAGVYPPKLLVK